MWQPPVTDRTQADIDRAKYLLGIGYDNLTAAEKSEWDAGMKGCRNIGDINRVLGNIQFLADQVGVTVYTLPTQQYSGWLTDNITYSGEMSDLWKILQNLQTLNDALSTAEPIPTDWLTFEGWNALEELLLTLSQSAGINNFPQIYAGDCYTGEENLI